MNADWTDSKTWTFETGEHIAIADGALRYCKNCVSKYPDAKPTLENLRRRATELRSMPYLNRETLGPLANALEIEAVGEGTGFTMLAKYVTDLYATMES